MDTYRQAIERKMRVYIYGDPHLKMMNLSPQANPASVKDAIKAYRLSGGLLEPKLRNKQYLIDSRPHVIREINSLPKYNVINKV